MEHGKETMRDLTCERLTVSPSEALQGICKDRECIVHVIAGKANLVIGPDGEQQWMYPLDASDTVWIPAETVFTLRNDGIGGLELSRYTYSAS